MRSFFVLVTLLHLGEAFAEEFNQLVFRKEFRLLPGIYFLHQALQLPVLSDLPNLNYKCSSHDEFRIRVSCPYARGDFVELMWRLAWRRSRASEQSIRRPMCEAVWASPNLLRWS